MNPHDFGRSLANWLGYWVCLISFWVAMMATAAVFIFGIRWSVLLRQLGF